MIEKNLEFNSEQIGTIEVPQHEIPFHMTHREVIGSFTMFSNHFHNQYEIYYLFSGERYYFIEDKIYHIKPGTLILIDKNILHKTKDSTKLDHLRTLINFSKNYFPSSPHIDELLNNIFTKNNRVLELLQADRQYVEDLINKMIREIQNKAIGYEIAIQSLFMEFLVFIRRYVEENQNNTPIDPTPMHEKISEIVHYINNNYKKDLSLPLISQKFYISQYYLSRGFKQGTGFTFIEYLNSIRVREAQRLLRETDNKVIDIMGQVGFKNISHFGRVFKEITNFSPLSYRKLNK